MVLVLLVNKDSQFPITSSVILLCMRFVMIIRMLSTSLLLVMNSQCGVMVIILNAMKVTSTGFHNAHYFYLVANNLCYHLVVVSMHHYIHIQTAMFTTKI